MDDFELKHKIADILCKAEVYVPANNNSKQHKRKTSILFIFILLLSGMLLIAWYRQKQPVSAISINRINALIKSNAQCMGKNNSSYKSLVKKHFNIYDFQRIDRQTADNIIKYLENNSCIPQ